MTEVNRKSSSRVWKVVRDCADVTSSGRQFHTWGPATKNARFSYFYVSLFAAKMQEFEDICEIC